MDDAEWDLMLAAQKDRALLARYHTLRTELLPMMREKDESRTSEALAQSLTSPWTKIVVGGAALVKAALTIYTILSNSGLSLRFRMQRTRSIVIGRMTWTTLRQLSS